MIFFQFASQHFQDENTNGTKNGNGNNAADDDYDDDDWTTDVSKEAVKQRMKVLIFSTLTKIITFSSIFSLCKGAHLRG